MYLDFSFDPSIVKSDSLSLSLKMSAINGPLTYESESSLNNYKVFSAGGVVIGTVSFAFYLISSYFHKMIGL
jgi:hypothetical protein